MKYFMPVLFLSLISINGFAAQNSRLGMSNKIMSAPRYTASVNQLQGMVTATNPGTVTNTSANSNGTEPVKVAATEVKVDMREAEKMACINNNIGIGNTFVWASRYSDTSNYADMVEDVVNPQNNVCFARVELKSDDTSRVSVSDIKPKYVAWGDEVECGSWANKSDLEKRILDAKKGNRVAGIVASSIGGAGIGVGAMELFGNKLIGNKVEGQKEMSGTTLLRSQLLTLKEKGKTAEYNEYIENLKTIKEACDNYNNNVPEFNCSDYESIFAEFVR